MRGSKYFSLGSNNVRGWVDGLVDGLVDGSVAVDEDFFFFCPPKKWFITTAPTTIVAKPNTIEKHLKEKRHLKKTSIG